MSWCHLPGSNEVKNSESPRIEHMLPPIPRLRIPREKKKTQLKEERTQGMGGIPAYIPSPVSKLLVKHSPLLPSCCCTDYLADVTSSRLRPYLRMRLEFHMPPVHPVEESRSTKWRLLKQRSANSPSRSRHMASVLHPRNTVVSGGVSLQC